MRIIVLGGTGLLGKTLQPILTDQGHEVLALGRSTTPSIDLQTGSGLAEAIGGTDVVVHLASDARKPKDTDVAGTRRILDALSGQHLVYMSIVGVDRHPFPYYEAKHTAEQLIESSGVQHTIFRATQFHDFLAFLLSKMCRRWTAFVPSGFVFQPVATSEVAAELAALSTGEPVGRALDMAGPEILDITRLARSFMTSRAREAPVITLPVPGKIGRAFREGVHTNPDRAVGRQTWDEFLEELHGR